LVEICKRGLKPFLPNGLEVVANLLAGQAQLAGNLGLGIALEVEVGDLRPVFADLIRGASLAALGKGLCLFIALADGRANEKGRAGVWPHTAFLILPAVISRHRRSQNLPHYEPREGVNPGVCAG
jgi:hypothetical protein